MEAPGHVQLLTVGGSSSKVDSLLRDLENAEHVIETRRIAGLAELPLELGHEHWDLAVIYEPKDLRAPRDAVATLHRSAPDQPIIVVTGIHDESAALSLLESGAAHVLSPDHQSRLTPILRRELGACTIRRRLKSTHEEFRAVVDNIGIGVALISPDFEILSLNRKMREWFPAVDPGQKPTCYRAYNNPPRDEPCPYCPTRLTLQDGQFHEARTETPTGGKTRHFRIVSSAIRDEDDRVAAAIELVEDVTAQVQHERLLHQHQIQLQEILERTPMGVLVVGHDQRIRWANSMVLEMAGLDSLGDVVGRHCTELMCTSENGRCPVLDLGETLDHSERLFHMVSGDTRPILKSVVPISLNGEDVLLETFIDISARKAEERRSLQSQKLESIGQLAAGIAHEINTPIQYIGDNTRFLGEALEDLDVLWAKLDALDRAMADGATPPELLKELCAAREESDFDFFRESAPESIAQVLEGVDRVATIVGALKNFAHPGSASISSTDINAAIESTITVCRNEWKYVADLTLELEDDLPAVTCVPGQVNQVLLNMVVNAAHAIAAAAESQIGELGKITITTRAQDGQINISIADTGTGIPEDVRGRIFDPFFTTKGVGQGTGQGLAIAHDVIVKKHGGRIEVESEVGRGTTFHITLPIDGSACSAKEAA